MSIEKSKEHEHEIPWKDYFTAADKKEIETGKRVFAQLKSGRHFDDWVKIGISVMHGSDWLIALHNVGTVGAMLSLSGSGSRLINSAKIDLNGLIAWHCSMSCATSMRLGNGARIIPTSNASQ